MDDPQIGKIEEVFLDPEMEQEEQQKASEDPTERKTILFATIIVIGLFALFFTGFYFYNSYSPTAKVVSIDELHQQNLQQELDETEGYIYNGYSLVKADGLWWTEVQESGRRVKIPLHFGPKELENITISGSLSEEFNTGNVVYIAIDPQVVSGYYVLAMRELSTNVAQGRSRDTQGACTREDPGCEDRRILNCDNPQNVPVIELRDAPETKIELRGSCIVVQGQGYGIIQAVDRLLYQWYGITKSE